MSLLLGQLVYTSFPVVGFKVLASAQVPWSIQQAFIQQVVHQYWDAYNPPEIGYRAAYLCQPTPEDTLFGWLYNDGLDEFGRSHVPYFVCYRTRNEKTQMMDQATEVDARSGVMRSLKLLQPLSSLL